MRDRIAIATPENVLFEHEVAELPSRALAWFLDLAVTAAFLAILGFVVQLVPSVIRGAGAFMMAVGGFVVIWGYTTIFEWRTGQTIGKRIVGLRTVGADGLPIGFVQAVVRNLLRLVDILPAFYLAGVLSALVDRRGRRLGDLAAGTWVVRERPLPLPSAILSASERHLASIPAATVERALRGITLPERDLMVELGRRRDSIPLSLRHELFEGLCTRLERRLGIERPAHISAEKLVLTLTALLMGASAQR